MARSIVKRFLLSLLILAISGCGSRVESNNDGADNPSHSKRGTGSSAGIGEIAPMIEGTGTIDASSAPGEVRSFLEEHQLANGDIYLKDGKIYINLVELNDETSRLLADRYKAGTYALVHVAHSIEELEAAQQSLTDNDLYDELNMYASSLDVTKNKIVITMPESSEAHAKPEIEKLIDPDLLAYDIQLMSEKPEYMGTIVKLDAYAHRILLLVDGEEEPSIFFGFDEHSEMATADGSPITFDDLKVQQEVRVWSTGMINDSLPAQATAKKLELVVPKA